MLLLGPPEPTVRTLRDQALDALPHSLSEFPNGVAFKIASSSKPPLFSNQALLSEASGYFETLFSSKAVEDVALEIEFEEDSDREDEGDGAVEEPKPKRRKTAQLEVSGDQQLITIRGVSYNTFRALLVFYLSGHIEFARLAHRYELESLKTCALAHIEACLHPLTAAYDAFTADSGTFVEVRDTVFDYMIANWTEVKTSVAWRDTLRRAVTGEFPHFEKLSAQLLLKISLL